MAEYLQQEWSGGRKQFKGEFEKDKESCEWKNSSEEGH